MKIDFIAEAVKKAAKVYPIKRVLLFGSQAEGRATEESDVDLIIEFSEPVTLITLAELKEYMEEILKKSVDIIHGPLRSDDLIEVNKEIEIYAA